MISTYTTTTDMSDGTTDRLNRKESVALTDGTGSDQADLLFHDTRSAAGAADALDLAGVLSNVFGATVTMVKIKLLVIVNNSTTSGETLKIGAGSNPITSLWGTSGDQIVIGPSTSANPAFLALSSPQDGYAITAGSADKLTIDPGAATVSYDIWIVGTTA
jgi:hypothetical protein